VPRNRACRVGLVDADGVRNPVLVQEHAQGLGTHHLVVLEDGVQADHAHLVLREQAVDAQGLRQAM